MLIRFSLLGLFILLVAAPASGYIVFLQDGSQVQTRDKYRIDGENAYLTLPSGTVTVLAAEEIDIAKTEEVNKVDLGTATLIEGGEQQQLAVDTRFEDEEETLADLARQRKTLSAAPRQPPVDDAPAEVAATVPRTSAGYVDLAALPRRDYPNEEIRLEIVRYLTGQGVERVTVYEGTSKTHPMLKITVNSEATVFQALEETAKVLIQMRDRFPQQVEAIDLYMTTSDEKPAGQFILTPGRAEMLTSGKVRTDSFFLRYVEF